jgi:hypothetical protein
MRYIPDFPRTLIVALIVCGISVLATPDLAAGGIKVHKANQYHKDNQNRDKNAEHYQSYHILNKIKHKHHSHHKSSTHSRKQIVLDSRFPNTYRDYSYYQKLQSQRYGGN